MQYVSPITALSTVDIFFNFSLAVDVGRVTGASDDVSSTSKLNSQTMKIVKTEPGVKSGLDDAEVQMLAELAAAQVDKLVRGLLRHPLTLAELWQASRDHTQSGLNIHVSIIALIAYLSAFLHHAVRNLFFV